MQTDLPKEEILCQWQAPLRVAVPRSREYYVTALAIASVVSLILFVAEGIMPVILIGTLCFLYWNLQKLPQSLTDYQLTNIGVRVEKMFYPWESFTNFWEEKKVGHGLFVLGHELGGAKIQIFTVDEKKLEIEKILKEKLKMGVLAKNNVEKMTDFVTSRLPQG